jgi:nucleoside-diphosphate-sugar epimerase
MKILITGSHGFVGGSFGRVAFEAGHKVLGVSRASKPQAVWPGSYFQVDLVGDDLCDIIREFAPDIVFHAAGAASVANSLVKPLDDFRTTVQTWINTLDAVTRSGCRPHVIYPSSAAVYGNVSELPVHEDAALRPISPYGFHKAACELLAREYAECFSLRITICRLFSLFGSEQHRLLVWDLYRQFADDNAHVYLDGTGYETRDYLRIDDACHAMMRLAELPALKTSERRPIVINVASGVETKVLDLANEIGSLVAPAKEVYCRGNERPGDPRAWQADVARLRSLFPDWHPHPLSISLADCIADWKKEGSG